MNNSVKTWLLIFGIGGTLAIGGTIVSFRVFNEAKHVTSEGGPTVDNCTWQVRVGSNVIVTTDKSQALPACSQPQVTNGLPSPGHPCAWVITISFDDNLNVYYDLPEDSIPCDQPVPTCASGPCS